ncbi:MAG: hypothetical protein ACJAQ4_000595 [Cryomorphaceae bacterium]|jgi:hypothetical protein
MHIQDDKSRIDRKIQNGYSFELEKYFSEGWNLFRKEPGPFVLYGLVAGLILASLNFLPEYLGEIASYLLGPALTAGLFIGARKLDQEGTLEFNDFFKGFDYIVQLFLVSLISGILISIGIVLLILPGIWLAVGVSLAVPLIVFTRLDFWESIKTSVKLVTKKWFHFFALIILLGIFNIIGVLFLVVGLLITFPVSYCILYAVYKDIVGFSSDNDDKDIRDHLVDDTI